MEKVPCRECITYAICKSKIQDQIIKDIEDCKRKDLIYHYSGSLNEAYFFDIRKKCKQLNHTTLDEILHIFNLKYLVEDINEEYYRRRLNKHRKV